MATSNTGLDTGAKFPLKWRKSLARIAAAGPNWRSIAYRLRIIYLPYLLVSVSFIIVYTGLAWTFLMRDGMYLLSEEIVQFFLPFALVWIPVLIWLLPRLKILQLNYGASSRLVLLTIAMVAPMFLLQDWLSEKAGKSAHVNRISQIDGTSDTNFFSVDSLTMDVQAANVHLRRQYEGRYHNKLRITACVILSLRDLSDNDRFAPDNIWLAQHFETTIGTGKTDSVRQRTEQNLIYWSLREAVNKRPADFAFFERIGKKNELWAPSAAIIRKLYPDIDPNRIVLLQGSTEPLGVRAARSARDACIVYGLAALAVLLMVLYSEVDTSRLRQYLKGVPTTNRLSGFPKELLRLQNGWVVTPVTIVLTVGIFLAMVLRGLGIESFQSKDLINWGASYPPLIHAGEWWRLITAVFLHGGLLHVYNNMAMLFFVGLSLETAIGSWKLAFVYTMSGVAGNLVSMAFHPADVGVGASGAVFGLCGLWIFCALTKRRKFRELRGGMRIIAICIVINLLLGFLPGPIDNAAHIGGLLSGAALGALLVPRTRGRGRISLPDGVLQESVSKDR